MDVRISQTGIRNGEYICASASGTQCQGTIMQIKSSNNNISYAPSSKYAFNDLCIRDKLSQFSFFSNLTFDQRCTWLKNNVSKIDDLYLNAIPDLLVRFESVSFQNVIGKGKNARRDPLLTEETSYLLLQGNPERDDKYWSIKYVYDLLLKGPNIGKKRSLMIFRPSNWCLYEKPICSNFTGIVCSLNSGNISRSYITSNIHVICNGCAITWLSCSDKIDITSFLNVIPSLKDDIISCMEHIKWFKPSFHKSLMQKCIRLRPAGIKMGDGKIISAKVVLLASFITLYFCPGALVPDLQKYVTGKESALKRLAVSIVEDGYVSDPCIITSLLSGALLTSCGVDFDINEDTIKMWLNACIECMDSPLMYEYNWHTASKIVGDLNNLSMNYVLIGMIKSFQSDIDMFSSVSDNKGIYSSIYIDSDNSNRIMELYHCIDHHCYPGIAWFCNSDILPDNYEKLFNEIWVNVTGINPRKTKVATVLGLPISEKENYLVKNIQDAQRMVMYNQKYKPTHVDIISDTYIDIEYTIDISWIAALVGTHEFKIKINLSFVIAIVVINPNDVHEFEAVKKPTRDDKEDTELTIEEKKEAILQFKNKLASGIYVKWYPDSMPELKDAVIYYYNDEYYIMLHDKEVTTWSSFANIKMKFPTVDYEKIHLGNYSYLDYICRFTSNVILKEAFEELYIMLSNAGKEIIERLIIYLSGSHSKIDLYKINRKGHGQDYTVSIVDTLVNHFLAELAFYFPAALSKSSSGYNVKSGPLMWYIFDIIKSYSLKSENEEFKWDIPFPETRTLMSHQIDSIDMLLKSNRRGDIIWIPPGLGKTAIIASYIDELIKINKMPKYCLYTLPPSAYETVSDDMKLRNIKFIHVDLRKSSKTVKKLIPGYVNLVYHDHLKYLNDDDISLSEILFVIDEFHKTLNKTLRTSSALRIAKLCHSFVAMSGTIIKDDNVEDLIQWLEMVVPFEVTKDNYWVAISALISKKCDTGIKVIRNVLEEEFKPDELLNYKKIVPVNLGGAADKIDFRAAVNISYDAITRRIINETLKYLNSRLGVFVVARNMANAEYIKSALNGFGVSKVVIMNTNNILSLTPDDPDPFDVNNVPHVAITIPGHCEGYNMTRYKVMITGVYFSNQATREQLERRINRLNQTSNIITINIIHAGIVSYIHKKYENVRSMAAAMKGFAREVNLDSLGDIDF